MKKNINNLHKAEYLNIVAGEMDITAPIDLGFILNGKETPDKNWKNFKKYKLKEDYKHDYTVWGMVGIPHTDILKKGNVYEGINYVPLANQKIAEPLIKIRLRPHNSFDDNTIPDMGTSPEFANIPKSILEEVDISTPTTKPNDIKSQSGGKPNIKPYISEDNKIFSTKNIVIGVLVIAVITLIFNNK